MRAGAIVRMSECVKAPVRACGRAYVCENAWMRTELHERSGGTKKESKSPLGLNMLK